MKSSSSHHSLLCKKEQGADVKDGACGVCMRSDDIFHVFFAFVKLFA